MENVARKKVAMMAPYFDEAEGEHAMTSVSGTFEVKLQPLSMEGVEPAEMLGRLSIDKRFQGGLEGTSKGQMLTVGTPVAGSAVYVAVERVTARLAGQEGTFALHHSGVMNRGEASLTVRIAPDSGTGGLTGISGSMAIRIENGAHFYALEYTLG
jgi:Protein of unknown function (DUF3224)